MMAMLFPIYMDYFAEKWSHIDKGEEFTLTVATLLPMAIILFIYLPWILPNFVFTTSIGEMYNEEAMKEAVWKTESYIAEHGAHKHKHSHDIAAVIKSEHEGHGEGHGHGGGGHGHDAHGHGGGGGGEHDDHGEHDVKRGGSRRDDHHGADDDDEEVRSSARGGSHSQASRRSN